MNKALKLLKVKPKDFPLGITERSGEKHFVAASKYIDMRPDGKHMVLFPENGFLAILTAEDVVSIKRHARRLKSVYGEFSSTSSR